MSTTGARFPHLSAHDSLTLWSNSLVILKLWFTLHTAPCFLSDQLEKYDSTLCFIVSFVTIIPLVQNNNPLKQTTLPPKLEFRNAISCSLSLFNVLVILCCKSWPSDALFLQPNNYYTCVDSQMFPLQTSWRVKAVLPIPERTGTRRRIWDGISIVNATCTVWDCVRNEVEVDWLLAANGKDSVAQLQALPISPVGLWPDDSTLRITVGTNLGTTICTLDICQYCEAEVSKLGSHGISCKWGTSFWTRWS